MRLKKSGIFPRCRISERPMALRYHREARQSLQNRIEQIECECIQLEHGFLLP